MKPQPLRRPYSAARLARDLNHARESEDLLLKIGMHEGPCLAVTLNDSQDYFGQTVNIASRVQNLATSRAIFATGSVINDGRASTILAENGVQPSPQRTALRGISQEFDVYELP